MNSSDIRVAFLEKKRESGHLHQLFSQKHETRRLLKSEFFFGDARSKTSYTESSNKFVKAAVQKKV